MMTKNITGIITVVLMLSLQSYGDNRKEEIADASDVSGVSKSERIKAGKKETDSMPDVALRNVRESKYRLTTEDIIANELKAAKDEYERMFGHKQPIPNCEQCSDLELLLILERAINAYYGGKVLRYIVDTKGGPYPNGNIKSVSYLKKEDMAKMKGKLRETEAKYEEKFGFEVPWWWMCQIDEHIRRLEKAIETGERYEECYGAGYREDYKFAKAMAAYELWFHKPVPEGINLNRNRENYDYLERALQANLPLLSYVEYTELKAKLEAEYQEKYWKTDFQRKYGKMPNEVISTARVYIYNGKNVHLSITRTVTGGAIAQDLTNGLSAPLELELSIGEWLDFINTLYNLTFEHDRKRREEQEKGRYGVVGIECYPGPRSQFDFDLLNDRWNITGFRVNVSYLNENDFKKVINDMAAKVKAKGKKAGN